MLRLASPRGCGVEDESAPFFFQDLKKLNLLSESEFRAAASGIGAAILDDAAQLGPCRHDERRCTSPIDDNLPAAKRHRVEQAIAPGEYRDQTRLGRAQGLGGKNAFHSGGPHGNRPPRQGGRDGLKLKRETCRRRIAAHQQSGLARRATKACTGLPLAHIIGPIPWTCGCIFPTGVRLFCPRGCWRGKRCTRGGGRRGRHDRRPDRRTGGKRQQRHPPYKVRGMKRKSVRGRHAPDVRPMPALGKRPFCEIVGPARKAIASRAQPR